MSSNPYAAPKAAVADATSSMQGSYTPGGRAVPAGRGWTWTVEGWILFKRQPGIWIALVVVFFLVMFALAFIPLLGSLLGFIIGPVFTAGFVYGSRELDEGRELEMGHLFAGFRERLGTLAAVGALYLAAWVVAVLIAALFTGASAWMLLGGSAEPVASGAAAATTVLLAVLVMLALMLPVFMAIWFAPQLVLFHDLSAPQAMRDSFFACLKNILPFLVYGAVMLLLAIIATIPIGLGWLVLLPVIFASIYTSYRDVFFSS